MRLSERDKNALKAQPKTFDVLTKRPEVHVRPSRTSDYKFTSSLHHPIPAILVMGLTGAGKSTFISNLAEENVEIGHRLGSCTTEVYGYNFRSSSGKQVYLIDTPGFDDSHLDDGTLLSKIATFLCTTFSHRFLDLVGLIYVHRITDTRMAGSSIKSLRIFEKLCGKVNYNKITIVTTMWDLLKSEDACSSASNRERDLQSMPICFGDLMSGGAEMKRQGSNYESARDIVEAIMQRENFVITDLQREMESDNATLADTTVGQFLSGELLQSQRKYKHVLEKLGQEYDEALVKRDEDEMSSIAEQKREFEHKVQQSEQNRERLSVTATQMEHEQIDWIKRMREEQKQKRDIENVEKSNRILELENEREDTKREHLRELDTLRGETKGQTGQEKGDSKPKQKDSARQKLQSGFLDKLQKFFTPYQSTVDDPSPATKKPEASYVEPKSTKHPKSRRSSKSGPSNSRHSSLNRQSGRSLRGEQTRPRSHIDNSWPQIPESQSELSIGPKNKQIQRAATYAGPVASSTTSELGSKPSQPFVRRQVLTTEPLGPPRNPPQISQGTTTLIRKYSEDST